MHLSMHAVARSELRIDTDGFTATPSAFAGRLHGRDAATAAALGKEGNSANDPYAASTRAAAVPT